MNKKEMYRRVKAYNKMCVVFERNGTFYKVYNRDVLIMWYLYKYKIIGNVVSFPIYVCRKIILELNRKSISVVVINNKAYELGEIIRNKLDLDIGNYYKIRDFVDIL